MDGESVQIKETRNKILLKMKKKIHKKDCLV